RTVESAADLALLVARERDDDRAAESAPRGRRRRRTAEEAARRVGEHDGEHGARGRRVRTDARGSRALLLLRIAGAADHREQTARTGVDAAGGRLPTLELLAAE